MARIIDGGSGCPGHHLQAEKLAREVSDIKHQRVSIRRSRVDFESGPVIERFLVSIEKIVAPSKREAAARAARAFADSLKEAADTAIETAIVAAEEGASDAAFDAACDALDGAVDGLKIELIKAWEAAEVSA